MGWLFAQVWVLCAAAFLAGAGVTWLAFVRPQGRRRAAHPHRRGRPASRVTASWRPAPVPGGHPEPLHPPLLSAPTASAVEPALAALDPHRADDPGRRPGRTAADALDRLGVTRPPADSGIQVPEQRSNGNDQE